MKKDLGLLEEFEMIPTYNDFKDENFQHHQLLRMKNLYFLLFGFLSEEQRRPFEKETRERNNILNRITIRNSDITRLIPQTDDADIDNIIREESLRQGGDRELTEEESLITLENLRLQRKYYILEFENEGKSVEVLLDTKQKIAFPMNLVFSLDSDILEIIESVPLYRNLPNGNIEYISYADKLEYNMSEFIHIEPFINPSFEGIREVFNKSELEIIFNSIAEKMLSEEMDYQLERYDHFISPFVEKIKDKFPEKADFINNGEKKTKENLKKIFNLSENAEERLKAVSEIKSFLTFIKSSNKVGENCTDATLFLNSILNSKTEEELNNNIKVLIHKRVETAYLRQSTKSTEFDSISYRKTSITNNGEKALYRGLEIKDNDNENAIIDSLFNGRVGGIGLSLFDIYYSTPNFSMDNNCFLCKELEYMKKSLVFHNQTQNQTASKGLDYFLLGNNDDRTRGNVISFSSDISYASNYIGTLYDGLIVSVLLDNETFVGSPILDRDSSSEVNTSARLNPDQIPYVISKKSNYLNIVINPNFNGQVFYENIVIEDNLFVYDNTRDITKKISVDRNLPISNIQEGINNEAISVNLSDFNIDEDSLNEENKEYLEIFLKLCLEKGETIDSLAEMFVETNLTKEAVTDGSFFRKANRHLYFKKLIEKDEINLCELKSYISYLEEKNPKNVELIDEKITPLLEKLNGENLELPSFISYLVKYANYNSVNSKLDNLLENSSKMNKNSVLASMELINDNPNLKLKILESFVRGNDSENFHGEDIVDIVKKISDNPDIKLKALEMALNNIKKDSFSLDNVTEIIKEIGGEYFTAENPLFDSLIDKTKDRSYTFDKDKIEDLLNSVQSIKFDTFEKIIKKASCYNKRSLESEFKNKIIKKEKSAISTLDSVTSVNLKVNQNDTLRPTNVYYQKPSILPQIENH